MSKPAQRQLATPPNSNRSFGILFTAVFFIIGVYPWAYGGPVRFWSLGIALAVLFVSLVRPNLLALPNRLWFRLGLALHKVVNPLVTGIIFFGAVTPTGLLARLFGINSLQKRLDKSAKSYWVQRNAGESAHRSLHDQF